MRPTRFLLTPAWTIVKSQCETIESIYKKANRFTLFAFFVSLSKPDSLSFNYNLILAP